MIYLKLIPYAAIALFGLWSVWNAFAADEARSDLLEMTARYETSAAIAEANAAAVVAIKASHDRALAALEKKTAEQEKLNLSLEEDLKEIRDAPKTYSCGPAVGRALDGLRRKPAP